MAVVRSTGLGSRRSDCAGAHEKLHGLVEVCLLKIKEGMIDSLVGFLESRKTEDERESYKCLLVVDDEDTSGLVFKYN